MNFVFRFKFNVLAVVAASLFTLTGVRPLKAAWVDTFDGGFDQTWTFDAYDTRSIRLGFFKMLAQRLARVVSDQLSTKRYH